MSSFGAETLAILIIVATVLGIVFRRFRQPTLAAYLLTGLLLGSAGLGIASETSFTEILAELGLVFLLFLIGLEIKLEEIKEILKPVVFIAVFQMIATAVIGFLLASWIGFNTVESAVIAAGTMFSSTAVVVKLLSDMDEISTLPGKIDVGILLIQDLVVVAILTILETGANTPLEIGLSILEIGLIAGGIASISYISSLYILPQIFEKISDNQHSFFIYGVAWGFLMITLAGELGISREIGAFIAGISLAQLPYSRELQERIRPLTDFFMAVFFINIGLGLSKAAILGYWKQAFLASLVLVTAKFGIISALADRMKFTPETSLKSGLNMSQISEFSLILGGVAASKGIVGQEVVGFLSIVAVTTIGISSYLISFNSGIVDRLEWLVRILESEEKSDVKVRELDGHALVIGYDALARSASRTLEEHFDDVVIVDRNPSNTSELARSDYEYIYGDFQHPEIRKASGIQKAAIIVSFAPGKWINRRIIEDADRDATVFAKSDDIETAVELYEMGASYVLLKNILAAEKISEYLELYLEDPEIFDEEIREETESIHWGGKSE